MESKYLYLILNLLAFIPAFALSFDRKVAYFRRWKYLTPSILVMGIIFIAWDVIFTREGIWGFNEQYLTGIDVLNLPLEEWLFFLTIPFASVFIYDCMKAYFPDWNFPDQGIMMAKLLSLLLLVMGITFLQRAYTSFTFIFLSILLFYLGYRRVSYLGRFFISYLLILVPFFIVNGILTGSGIEAEVVWYNDQENLATRLFTIPVEDIFYGMLLILGNVALYEFFQSKKMALGLKL